MEARLWHASIPTYVESSTLPARCCTLQLTTPPAALGKDGPFSTTERRNITHALVVTRLTGDCDRTESWRVVVHAGIGQRPYCVLLSLLGSCVSIVESWWGLRSCRDYGRRPPLRKDRRGGSHAHPFSASNLKVALNSSHSIALSCQLAALTRLRKTLAFR